MRSFVTSLLGQPLLQFLLLGLVIFGVDRSMLVNTADPRLILIDDARYAEIAGIYRDNQGQLPTEQQMAELTVTWAQNEVLYREARLMELDQGDEMIRQRLILKLRNVLFNRVVTQAPPPEALEAWFEANRTRYDKPETFDFEQFQVADVDGAAEAVSLAAELGSGAPTPAWEGKRRKYYKRPAANLEAVFGTEDARRMIDSPNDRWLPVSSPAGWHLSRVIARHPGERAELTAMRNRVLEDWKADAIQTELAQSLQAIARGYDIRLELSAPPEAWDDEQVEAVRLALGAVE